MEAIDVLTINSRIFNLLVRKLLLADGLSPVEPVSTAAEADSPDDAEEIDPDFNSYLYNLKTLSNVLKWSSNRTWSIMADEMPQVNGTGRQTLTARKCRFESSK